MTPLPSGEILPGVGCAQSDAGEPPVPLRVRIGGAIAALIILVYAACCLVYNAPSSPAKSEIPVGPVMNPYFVQNWMLFGPNPSTSNYRFLLRAKLEHGGKVTTTAPVDIEYAIDRLPRQDPLSPTRMPGILLSFQRSIEDYENQLAAAQSAPKAQRAGLTAQVGSQFSIMFQELERFLSAQAQVQWPDTQIVEVQSTLVDQPITPWTQRDQGPSSSAGQPIFQTQWMAYVPGVES